MMTDQRGGTLVAERPSALITQVLGSTSGLTWKRCELPIEATTCPVPWCQGIHCEPDFDGAYMTHERDIAQATRDDGALVLEVSVLAETPIRRGMLIAGGSGGHVARPRPPQIIMHLYTTELRPFRGYWLEHWRHANGFGTLLRLLGEDEFAGAITDAYDLCREIEGVEW